MRPNRLFYVVFISLFITGCAPYEQVQDVIYLQNAYVKVPVSQMPVFVNTNDMNDKTFFIRPRFFFGNTGEYQGNTGNHSKVNELGTFQYDSLGPGDYVETVGANRYQYTGANYNLQSTNLNVGFDADLFFSRTFGISGGINFSSIDNINLNGGHAGVILKNFENNSGMRFDAGVAWQQSEYDVQSIIVRTQKEWYGDTESFVFFTRDRGIQTNFSFYLNLNLSYDDPSSIIGGFLNIGYIQQKILDIQPYEYDQDYYYTWYYGTYNQTDLRTEVSTGFLSLNGGLLTNVMNGVKVMGGVKYYYELKEEQTFSSIVSPFLQLQFGI